MKTIGTMLCLASLLLLAACTAGPEEAAGTQDAPCLGRRWPPAGWWMSRTTS